MFYVVFCFLKKISLFKEIHHFKKFVLSSRQLLERGIFRQGDLVSSLPHLPRRVKCRNLLFVQNAVVLWSLPGESGHQGLHSNRTQL